jgi:hypothetical protein
MKNRLAVVKTWNDVPTAARIVAFRWGMEERRREARKWGPQSPERFVSVICKTVRVKKAKQEKSGSYMRMSLLESLNGCHNKENTHLRVLRWVRSNSVIELYLALFHVCVTFISKEPHHTKCADALFSKEVRLQLSLGQSQKLVLVVNNGDGSVSRHGAAEVLELPSMVHASNHVVKIEKDVGDAHLEIGNALLGLDRGYGLESLHEQLQLSFEEKSVHDENIRHHMRASLRTATQAESEIDAKESLVRVRRAEGTFESMLRKVADIQ